MSSEVHRVVQKSEDLHRARRIDAVDEDVPRGSASLSDVVGEDARANVFARLAELGIVRDSDQRFRDQGTVLASLVDSRCFVNLRTSTMSRFAGGERTTRAICARRYRSKTDFRVDLGHELLGGGLDAVAGIELGDGGIHRLSHHRAPLFVEGAAYDIVDARALTGADALLGEGLQVFRQLDLLLRGVGHGRTRRITAEFYGGTPGSSSARVGRRWGSSADDSAERP